MKTQKLLLALAVLAAPTLASAAPTVDTWTGAVNTDFENSGNWTGGTPANQDGSGNSGTMATFNAVTANQPSTTVNRSLAGVNFTQAGWTLGGTNTINFGDTRVTNTIMSAGSGTNTISAPIDGLLINFQAGSGNTLVINNVVAGDIAPSVFGAGTIRFAGVGGGNFFKPIAYDGSDATVVEIAVGFNSSGEVVNKGTLRLLADNLSLGDEGSSIFTINNGGTMDTNGHNMTWGGFQGSGGILFGTGGGTLETEAATLIENISPRITTTATNVTDLISGNIQIHPDRNDGFFTSERGLEFLTDKGNTPTGVDLLVTSNISNDGGAQNVYKHNAGTLKFTGNNTYSNGGGTTEIEQGTLLVSNTSGSGTGSGNVLVDAAGTLGGKGFITMATGKTLTNNGTISPGESIGTLTVSGNVIFGPSSHYLAQIDSATSDLLAITGTVGISGNVSIDPSSILDLSQIARPGQSEILMTWTGTRTGIFGVVNGLPSGFYLKYNDFDPGGNLTLVGPEPATLSMLGLSGAMLLARRRKHVTA